MWFYLFKQVLVDFTKQANIILWIISWISYIPFLWTSAGFICLHS